MTNQEKIKVLNEITNNSKDLIEFLRIEPKLKININQNVINERIAESQKAIKELAQGLN